MGVSVGFVSAAYDARSAGKGLEAGVDGARTPGSRAQPAGEFRYHSALSSRSRFRWRKGEDSR